MGNGPFGIILKITIRIWVLDLGLMQVDGERVNMQLESEFLRSSNRKWTQQLELRTTNPTWENPNPNWTQWVSGWVWMMKNTIKTPIKRHWNICILVLLPNLNRSGPKLGLGLGFKMCSLSRTKTGQPKTETHWSGLIATRTHMRENEETWVKKNILIENEMKTCYIYMHTC